MTLWLDDPSTSSGQALQKQSLTFVDNDTRTLTDVRLGAQGVDAGTNGTLYFDDFESRRFSYIGTLTDPGVDDPTATNPAGWFTRTYTYSTTIPHAVTNVTPETGSPDTYEYDANGNMTCRVEDGVTYKQDYNAENRISAIHKMNGTCSTGTVTESWLYAYDGDGTRVVTAHYTGVTLDSLTSYYMGGAYEVTGTQVKKYYSMAGQTIMRDSDGSLKYLLTDHLGSTSAVTDQNGTLLSQQRYLPFGEVRTDTNPPYITQTDFTYTGQRNLSGTGLMDYKFRMYSPTLGRFISPDSIIPNASNPQAFNRFGYVYNNPINFIDPSGHISCNLDPDECSFIEKTNKDTNRLLTNTGGKTSNPLVEFSADDGQEWTADEQEIIEQGVQDVASALAREMNKQCRELIALGEGCSNLVTAEEAFYEVFGGSITVRRSGSDCDCWAMHQGVINGHYEIWVYSTTSAQDIIAHPLLIVHEIGHAFDVARGLDANTLVPNNLLRPTNSDGIIGTDSYGHTYGYAGPHYQWQFGRDSNNRQGEEFADMFVGWVYNQWERSDFGIMRRNFMNPLMVSYLP